MVVAAVVEAVAVVPMLLVTCAAWAVVWVVLLPTEVAMEALAMAAMAALHPTAGMAVATAVVMETPPALLAHLPGGKLVVVSGEAIESGCLLSSLPLS